MSAEPKDYSIHFIGLGGTGANIVEAFLSHPRIYPFLGREGVKISCLVLDVADHDIMSLQRAYDRLVEELKARGIPSEKISFIAKSVRFPTPEAMFEFIEKYPEFLKLEGAKVPENYMPWLSSSMEIPPLAGGVGRRRALAKAIYGLNYHYLRLIDGYAESFKESVSSSTLQPVIFVIFGIGGGSGGGMAVDFVRHLRRKLGSGFPILGLGILPCQGDDPPAKGASAHAALNELELLLDKDKNGVVRRAFGKVYENPFTAFIMMPLGPPYSKSGNLLDAKRLIDDAIVDILMNTLRFDLADLLNNIGANLDLADRWIHTVTSLRVTYPINENIELVKLYLSRLDRLRPVRRDKLEMCRGPKEEGVAGLYGLISASRQELLEVYRRLLIEKGTFEEAAFEKALAEYVYADKQIEVNINVQVKGMEEAVRNTLDEVARPVLSIGLEAHEGTPEARLQGLVQQIADRTRRLSHTHARYHEFAEAMIDDMNSSIAGTPSLTFRQKLLLGDLLDLVRLTDAYLTTLRRYMETKTLGDKLFKELSRGEKTEARQRDLKTVQRILNPELVALFSLLAGIFSPPATELKSVDAHLTGIRAIKRALSERLDTIKIGRQALEARVRSLQNEVDTIIRELKKAKVPLLAAGKRRFLEQKKLELEHKLRLVKADFDAMDQDEKRLTGKLEEYSAIERKIDVNSEYRVALRDAVDLANRHYEKLNEISRDRGYYDRVAEIGEEERLKIMQRILGEEEASLTRENILREIVDRRRLKDYLTGVMRILRLPSTLGLTAAYRTDYMWVTVVAPRGVWDHDLNSELKTALSGYIAGEASRSIAVREVDSEDPWTIRFLVIAGKARRGDLDIYEEMHSLYEQAPKGDKVLAHSFLLEQGLIATPEIVKQLKASPEHRLVP